MLNPSSKRQEAALRTQNRILAAAKEVYAIDASAPVLHVAQKAGVAEGTVFAHFPDKISLLVATLEEEIYQALAFAEANLQQQAPCKEQILFYAKALYAFYDKRPAFFRVVLSETLFARGEWGKRHEKLNFLFISQLVDCIDNAKIKGEYHQHVNSQVVAEIIFSRYLMGVVGGLQEEMFNAEAALQELSMALVQLEKGLSVQGENNVQSHTA